MSRKEEREKILRGVEKDPNHGKFSRSCTETGKFRGYFSVGLKGGWKVAQKDACGKTLRSRIQSGRIRREDVTRRLAELAFGQPNDCVRLALEEMPDLQTLDLSRLSEIKRNEKGMVEIKLIDRLRALEQLSQSAAEDPAQMEEFLRALQSAAMEE